MKNEKEPIEEPIVSEKKEPQKCITCRSAATELNKNNTVCHDCLEFESQSSYTMSWSSYTTFRA